MTTRFSARRALRVRQLSKTILCQFEVGDLDSAIVFLRLKRIVLDKCRSLRSRGDPGQRHAETRRKGRRQQGFEQTLVGRSRARSAERVVSRGKDYLFERERRVTNSS